MSETPGRQEVQEALDATQRAVSQLHLLLYSMNHARPRLLTAGEWDAWRALQFALTEAVGAITDAIERLPATTKEAREE